MWKSSKEHKVMSKDFQTKCQNRNTVVISGRYKNGSQITGQNKLKANLFIFVGAVRSVWLTVMLLTNWGMMSFIYQTQRSLCVRL